MALGEFVEHGSDHLVGIGESLRVGVWDVGLVERERGLVERGLRRLQVGFRAAHHFFHRHVGSEGEMEFLAELLGAEPEITGGAGEQIVLQPSPVIGEGGGGFFLERGELLLGGGVLLEERREAVFD